MTANSAGKPSMFHILTLPDGERLVINTFDICDILESTENGKRYVTFSLRNGHTWTVVDQDRERLDEFLAHERGYPEPMAGA